MNPVIGFDAKRAATNNTGLGNYSRLVIDLLSEEGFGRVPPRLNLYTPRPGKVGDRLRPLLARPGVELIGPSSPLSRAFSGIWRLRGGITGRIIADGVTLFHGLSNELPLDIARARIPTVVTVHDAIFRRCPENYKPVDRAIYDFKWRRAVANATRIIAISQCTRRDIIDLYGADPARIDVVYQGCDPIFLRPVTPADTARVAALYSLPPLFIACVGTIEPRKNQMLAVRALTALPPEVRLVIVGRPREPYASALRAAAARLGVAGRIIWLRDIPFADIPAIYASSFAAAYVSRYEGFGLPVIEALAAGAPVIAATGSCLEEAGGPGALYVGPDIVSDFVTAARALLDSTQLRDRLVAAGRRHIASFGRTNFRSGLLETYARAADDFARVARRKK